MRDFVANQNIARFRHQLDRGVEPATRATLLNLLLQEEQQLGQTSEQLTRVERHIELLRHLMAKQVELVDRLRSSGDDAARPQLLLATLNDLMLTYQAHRQWIVSALAAE